jgi:hypothetical protein
MIQRLGGFGSVVQRPLDGVTREVKLLPRIAAARQPWVILKKPFELIITQV